LCDPDRTSYVGAQGQPPDRYPDNAGSTQNSGVDPFLGLVQFHGSPLWQ
jgi:hypothetical protein